MKKSLGVSLLALVVSASLILTGCGPLPNGVELEVDGTSASVEFSGVVESIATDAWLIAGQTILIGADTEIENGISVGNTAEVNATVASDGSITAVSIELFDDVENDIPDNDNDDEEIELTGAVEEISADSWTIAGVTFLVTADTEIEDLIIVGDIVKVEAKSDGLGGFIATEIKLADDSADSEDTDLEDDEETELTGAVEAISAESWIIAGVTFLVTADTEIEDTIVVGDIVKVEAKSDDLGGYIAMEIELADDSDDSEDSDLDDDEGDDDEEDDDDGDSESKPDDDSDEAEDDD